MPITEAQARRALRHADVTFPGAELHAALLAAEAEFDAGQAVSEADLWARLRTAK